MIIVRETFHIDPSRMKIAKELLKEMGPLGNRLGMNVKRICTDLTGDYYRLVMDSEFENLGEFESNLSKSFSDPEWQTFYGKLRPMITSGRREIFSTVNF